MGAGNGRSQGWKGGDCGDQCGGGDRIGCRHFARKERYAMVGSAVRFVVVLAAVGAVWCGGVAHEWEKRRILPRMGLSRWRATSFALGEEKVFLSLVDVGKEESGNGVVVAFNMSTSTSPEVAVFPFQNFYKVNDPLRGKITTPIAVRMDDCHRLWLLDAAVQNISGSQHKSAPGIHVFNTNTSQLIRSFNLPNPHWTPASFFVNFVLDTDSTQHDCEQTFAYLADFNRFHLLTYDFLRNTSALKSHPFFSPDPLLHTPDDLLLNPRLQDRNGLFGLALAPRTLYFHPLAATHEFKVTTRALRAEGDLAYHDVQVFRDKGERAEAGPSVVDRETGTLFFGEVNSRKIGAVGLSDPQDAAYCRYDLNLTAGYIVDLSVRRSELWVLVDDQSHVRMYRLPIADISEELRRSRLRQPTPAAPGSASRAHLSFALLTAFLPLRFRL